MTTEGDQGDNWRTVKIKGLEDLLSLAQGFRIAKAEQMCDAKMQFAWGRKVVYFILFF